MEDEGLSEILAFIGTTPDLYSLEICDLLPLSSFSRLSTFFLSKSESRLSNLVLDHSPVTDEGIQALIPGLVRFPHLKHLSLNYCSLTIKGTAPLLLSLFSATSLCCLEELQLQGNEIGSGLLELLGSILASTTTLRSINLSDTNLGQDPVAHAAFVSGLRANRSLTRINLELNDIGDAAAEQLCSIIESERRDIFSLRLIERINPSIFQRVVQAEQTNRIESLRNEKPDSSSEEDEIPEGVAPHSTAKPHYSRLPRK
ncbi:hypothetical protein BLNAU_790 [Blattamonas nauphoetae]|uniref:Uncharacterized protein n=1 Tax=Blattamonas nauphoetae TaxID=2049346 RepID=A0ABQ9YKH5_9EUKA|nr:hypothetical protein BLNAU_790 [Blattamonas nauphoetae]